MNVVLIRGNLRETPTVREVGRTRVVEFTVGVPGTRWDQDSGEQVVSTTWVRCQAWHLAGRKFWDDQPDKGDDVHVVGQLDQQVRPDAAGKADRKTRIDVVSAEIIRKAGA